MNVIAPRGPRVRGTPAAGRRVSFLTTCARNHFTWQNELLPGRQRIGNLDVHFFPVDEDRDLGTFLEIQQRISNRREVTPDEERAWIDNSVNSRALYEHLRAEGGNYDRIVLGPYLFGVAWHAARIHPRRTLLVPCLHDEPFAGLGIMRDLFGDVAGCLFNAEPERDLARRLYGFPEEKGRVVGMGLDSFAADPTSFARRRNLKRPYLLYCGRREAGKGTPIILDYTLAFRERTGRDIGLVFTGSGPLDLPEGLEDHVLDLGFVSEEEKHEVMAGAAAFIHPSVNESLGSVLLESWLAGAPALVHAGSAVLQWQCRRSGGGLWFRSYPEFEEALRRLLDDPALRNAMGGSGRRYVLSEYAWPKVEQRLFAALSDLGGSP